MPQLHVQSDLILNCFLIVSKFGQFVTYIYTYMVHSIQISQICSCFILFQISMYSLLRFRILKYGPPTRKPRTTSIKAVISYQPLTITHTTFPTISCENHQGNFREFSKIPSRNSAIYVRYMEMDGIWRAKKTSDGGLPVKTLAKTVKTWIQKQWETHRLFSNRNRCWQKP